MFFFFTSVVAAERNVSDERRRRYQISVSAMMDTTTSRPLAAVPGFSCAALKTLTRIIYSILACPRFATIRIQRINHKRIIDFSIDVGRMSGDFDRRVSTLAEKRQKHKKYKTGLWVGLTRVVETLIADQLIFFVIFRKSA